MGETGLPVEVVEKAMSSKSNPPSSIEDVKIVDAMSGPASCDCTPSFADGSQDLELFVEGDELYATMLSAIATAKRYIGLESYIFADDEIGQRFAEALAERANAGVSVRLHIDAAGSLFWTSRRLERYLREHKVHVRWFHRWSWRKPLRYNRRNHRKLLVVDGIQAFIGGFNIHRQNSRSVFGERRWRDSHLRLGGNLAAQAAELFQDFWFKRRLRRKNHIAEGASILLSNNSRNCRRQLRCAYNDMFTGAHRSIYLTTPYFVPDRGTQRALVLAAKRHVDVRLLVPRKGDVRLVRWASRAAYSNLLGSGVRIYEYLPRVLHAKTAVVDGEYGTIGTANLDYRSFFVNHELNVFTRDPVLCSTLQAQFLNDLNQAEEIQIAQWRRRPWTNQLFEMVGWMARRWL